MLSNHKSVLKKTPTEKVDAVKKEVKFNEEISYREIPNREELMQAASEKQETPTTGSSLLSVITRLKSNSVAGGATAQSLAAFLGSMKISSAESGSPTVKHSAFSTENQDDKAPAKIADLEKIRSLSLSSEFPTNHSSVNSSDQDDSPRLLIPSESSLTNIMHLEKLRPLSLSQEFSTNPSSVNSSDQDDSPRPLKRSKSSPTKISHLEKTRPLPLLRKFFDPSRVSTRDQYDSPSPLKPNKSSPDKISHLEKLRPLPLSEKFFKTPSSMHSGDQDDSPNLLISNKSHRNLFLMNFSSDSYPSDYSQELRFSRKLF